MTYFLCFGIGTPAIVFGAVFQNGPEVVLGLIALGMAAVGFVGWILVRLFVVPWSTRRRLVDRPLETPLGYARIGSCIYDREDAA